MLRLLKKKTYLVECNGFQILKIRHAQWQLNSSQQI